VVVVNADLEAAVVEALLGFGWVDHEAARRLLAAVLGTTVEADCRECGGSGEVIVGFAHGDQVQDCGCSDGKVLLGIGEQVR
jgi:hypothetical protein